MIVTPEPIHVPLHRDTNGKLRIGETSILLEIVIHAFRRGETPEEIIDSYPTLKLSDVYAVITYYLTRPGEVDAYVRLADEAADRIQRDTEINYSPETLTLRTRLRALRDNSYRTRR